MTDDRIKNLERELNRLEKEYGEIGAYKEYGDVIRGVIGLTNQLDKKVQGLEAKLAKPGLKATAGNSYKKGILTVELKGKNTIVLYPCNVSIIGDKKYHKATTNGRIQEALRGGEYTVKATVDNLSQEVQVTVDGNTYVEIAFPI